MPKVRKFSCWPYSKKSTILEELKAIYINCNTPRNGGSSNWCKKRKLHTDYAKGFIEAHNGIMNTVAERIRILFSEDVLKVFLEELERH